MKRIELGEEFVRCTQEHDLNGKRNGEFFTHDNGRVCQRVNDTWGIVDEGTRTPEKKKKWRDRECPTCVLLGRRHRGTLFEQTCFGGQGTTIYECTEQEHFLDAESLQLFQTIRDTSEFSVRMMVTEPETQKEICGAEGIPSTDTGTREEKEEKKKKKAGAKRFLGERR